MSIVDFSTPSQREQRIEGFFVIALLVIVAIIVLPILAEGR